MIDHITKKRYGKFKGINKRDSELARDMEGFATNIKNAQFRDSEALSKRKGTYLLNQTAGTGGYGLITYGKINLYNGDVLEELIAIGPNGLTKLTEMSNAVRITYSRHMGEKTAYRCSGGSSTGEETTELACAMASGTWAVTVIGDTEINAESARRSAGHQNTPRVETIIQDDKLKLVIKDHVKVQASIRPAGYGQPSPITWEHVTKYGLHLISGHTLQVGDECEIRIIEYDNTVTLLITLSTIEGDFLPKENFINSQWYQDNLETEAFFDPRSLIWATSDRVVNTIDLGTGIDGSTSITVEALKTAIEGTQTTGSGNIRADLGTYFDIDLVHWDGGNTQPGVHRLDYNIAANQIIIYKGHTLKKDDVISFPVIYRGSGYNYVDIETYTISKLEDFITSDVGGLSGTTASKDCVKVTLDRPLDGTNENCGIPEYTPIFTTDSSAFTATLSAEAEAVKATMKAVYLEPLEEQNIPRYDSGTSDPGFIDMKGLQLASNIASTNVSFTKYLPANDGADSKCENASTSILNGVLYIANGKDNLMKYDGVKFYRAGISNPTSLPTAPVNDDRGTYDVKGKYRVKTDTGSTTVSGTMNPFFGKGNASSVGYPVPIYEAGGLGGVCTTGYCVTGDESSDVKNGYSREECVVYGDSNGSCSGGTGSNRSICEADDGTWAPNTSWHHWTNFDDCMEGEGSGQWILNDKPDNTLYTFRYKYQDRMNNEVYSDIPNGTSLIYYEGDPDWHSPAYIKVEGGGDDTASEKYAVPQMIIPAVPNQDEYNVVSITPNVNQQYDFDETDVWLTVAENLLETTQYLVVGDIIYFWADKINTSQAHHTGTTDRYAIEGFIYAEVSAINTTTFPHSIKLKKDSVKDYNRVPVKYSEVFKAAFDDSTTTTLESVWVLQRAIMSTAQVEIYRTKRKSVLREGIDLTDNLFLCCIIPLANTTTRTVNYGGVGNEEVYEVGTVPFQNTNSDYYHRTIFIDKLTSTALPGLGEFNRTTSTGHLPGPPPLGKYLTPFQGHLAYSGFEEDPNGTVFSTFDSPEMVPPAGVTQFLTEARFGDKVTGSAMLGNTLYIFQKKSVWAVTGDVQTMLLRVDLISASGAIGCEAHQTVLEVAEAIFFLTNKGIYFIGKSDTQNEKDVTAKVPEELSIAVAPDFLSLDSSYNLKKAIAFYWADEDIYFLQIPKEKLVGTAPNELLVTESSEIFVYDVYRTAWFKWEGLDFSGGITVLGKKVYFTSRREDLDDNDFASAHYRIASESTPQAYNDHVRPIEFEYETNWDSLGEASLPKKFLRLKTYAAEVTDTFETDTYSLKLELQKDFVPNTLSTTDILFDEKIYGGWNGGPWDEFIWGQGIVPYKTTKLFNEKTTAMKMILKNNNNSENVLLSGYELEIAVPYHRGIKE